MIVNESNENGVMQEESNNMKEKIFNHDGKGEKEKKPVKLIDYLMWGSIAALLFVLVGQTIINLYHPVMTFGHSMEPTLHTGEIHITDLVNDDTELKRGDIISFPYKNKSLMKRIVGCPGDELVIKDGVLYVNGVADERYEYIEFAGILSENIVLKENEYFGIGDNVNNSGDCRICGPVTKNNIELKLREQL